jgi:thioredoxin-like negative regulator of GroEL
MTVHLADLTRDSFEELVTNAEQTVIIDFWGPQCAPCLALGPVYETIAQSRPEMRFLRAEAPANRMLCVNLKVMSLPTFLCMVDGAEVSRLTGQFTAADLKRWVKEQAQEVKGDS